MLFNSVEYFIFLIFVVAVFWGINKFLKIRNVFILAVSYLFYGLWDYRFLGLILASTLVDFYIGKLLGQDNSKKKSLFYLWTSVIFNIGLLLFFKYFNFFIESFVDLSNMFGFKPNINSLNIILPVGISFYTFQTLSYSIDIHRGRLKPTTSLLNFATFVAFFPQLVAGPIEKASVLIPQLERKSIFKYENFVDGLRLILFGLFKKVVIADQLSFYVNPIFEDPSSCNGGELFLGALYFSFQVYGDFSGYSDIAIGSAMLLGFTLMSNFKFPFFSQNLAEYWRRWHISLNTWFNDYLFMSLALIYRAKGKVAIIASLFFTFLISGFWHGARWNFILWGIVNGIFFIIPFLKKGKRIKGMVSSSKKGIEFTRKSIPLMLKTFLFNVIAFALFRSTSVDNMGVFFKRLILNFNIPSHYRGGMIFVIVLLVLDFIFRNDERKVLIISDKSRLVRYSFYSVLLICVLFSFELTGDFIYFQF